MEAGLRRLQQFQDAAAGRSASSASPGPYDGARLQHLELEKELLQTECLELHKILEEARRQNNRIEDEKDAMRVELEELRRSRWEAGSKPLSDTGSVRGLTSPVRSISHPSPEASPSRHLTHERDELLRRLEELSERHQTAEKKAGELQSLVNKLQPKQDECRQLRAQLSTSQTALKEAESAKDGAKQEWMREKQKLLDRIKGLKADVDRAGHSLKGKDAEIARLQAELRDAALRKPSPERASLTEILQLREELQVSKSRTAELHGQLARLRADTAGSPNAAQPGGASRTQADMGTLGTHVGSSKSPFDRGRQEQLSHSFELEARLVLEEERAKHAEARVAQLETDLSRVRTAYHELCPIPTSTKMSQKGKQAGPATRPSPSSAPKATTSSSSHASPGAGEPSAAAGAGNLADVEKRHQREMRKLHQLVKEHAQRGEAQELVIERSHPSRSRIEQRACAKI